MGVVGWGRANRRKRKRRPRSPIKASRFPSRPQRFFPAYIGRRDAAGKQTQVHFPGPIFFLSLSGKRRRTRGKPGRKGQSFFLFSQPGGKMACLRKGGIASSASAWVAFRRERCLCVTPTRRRPRYKQKKGKDIVVADAASAICVLSRHLFSTMIPSTYKSSIVTQEAPFFPHCESDFPHSYSMLKSAFVHYKIRLLHSFVIPTWHG